MRLCPARQRLMLLTTFILGLREIVSQENVSPSSEDRRSLQFYECNSEPVELIAPVAGTANIVFIFFFELFVNFKPGVIVEGEANGQPVRGAIVNVEEEIVRIDFNHPLSGKDLNFDIELVEVNK